MRSAPTTAPTEPSVARPRRDTAVNPLAGVRVLDLSTLLPGPLASLILAEAGADVIKVERPDGDSMSGFAPRVAGEGVAYTLLNRRKRVVRVDLKDATARADVLRLAADADVVLEQFRPGVAGRLGLGYDDVRALNPGVVYCSITGYGQSGPRRAQVGHDLNYLAETGLLAGVTGRDGRPGLPPVLAADVGGGSFPAVMNIVMALFGRERTGVGCHLDIAMTTNLQSFALNQIAAYVSGEGWPVPDQDLLTGGTPRYQVYRAADGRYIAAAPLEQHFWERFCEILALPSALRDERGQESVVLREIQERIAMHGSEHWRAVLCDADTACTVVATLDEARAAGLYDVPERVGPDPVVERTELRTPTADVLRGVVPLAPPIVVGADVDWSPVP